MLIMLAQVRPDFLEVCIARGPCWGGTSGSACALSRRDLWPFATPSPLAWQRPSSRPRCKWWAQSGWCERLLIVWRWTCSTQEVGCVVVVDVGIVPVVGGNPWRTGVFLPLPASGPLSILNAHFLSHPCSGRDWVILFTRLFVLLYPSR